MTSKKNKLLCNVCKTAIGVFMGFASLSIQAHEWIYTVRPGDTLWDIIGKYSVDLTYVSNLQSFNNIENPKKIRPGTTLRIPVKWLKNQPASVEVVSIVGQVSFNRENETESAPLTSNDQLIAGDMVSTEQGGNVVFRFADGSKMFLRQNSHLEFDTLSKYGDTGMVDTRGRLHQGEVDAKATKQIGGGSRFEIHSPGANTVVRGTEYRLRVDNATKATFVEVLEGLVDVIGQGNSAAIPAEFGGIVQLGKPPGPTHELLPAPDVASLPTDIEQLPIRFAWQDLEGAVSYRFLLSNQEDFSLLMDEQLTEQTGIGGVSVPTNGQYYARIRGLDGLGLEGQDATHSFIVRAYPKPPVMLAPISDQVLRLAQPEFAWGAPVDAVGYRFELAQNDQFEPILINQESIDKPKFELAEPLQPGTYFWRLATLGQSGETGPYSDTSSFTYEPPPPGPQHVSSDLSDKTLEFNWRSGIPGQKFHLQLARDANFVNLATDEMLDESTYSMQRPSAGSYYIRISTVDTDGSVGEFGVAQKVEIPSKHLWEGVFSGLAVLILLL